MPRSRACVFSASHPKFPSILSAVAPLYGSALTFDKRPPAASTLCHSASTLRHSERSLRSEVRFSIARLLCDESLLLFSQVRLVAQSLLFTLLAPSFEGSLDGTVLLVLPCGTVTPDCALGFAFVRAEHRSTPSWQPVACCHPDRSNGAFCRCGVEGSRHNQDSTSPAVYLFSASSLRTLCPRRALCKFSSRVLLGSLAFAHSNSQSRCALGFSHPRSKTKIRINNYKVGPISVLNFPHHTGNARSPRTLCRQQNFLPNLQPFRRSQLRVRRHQTLPRRAPPQMLSRHPPQRIALLHRHALLRRPPAAHNLRRHQHRAPQQQQLRRSRVSRIHPAQFPPTRSFPQINLRQFPPRIPSLHFAQNHHCIPRRHFRFHSQQVRARLTRRTRHYRRHTQRPRLKWRHAPRRSFFRPRLHQHLRRRHRSFRHLHRKLRTISLSCCPRRFPLRFLLSVTPRHFPKRFLSRRTLAAALRLLLFLIRRIILARRNFSLILRCEDLRPLQIVVGINMVGTLRLRGLTRFLLPRRFGRILRVQSTRTHQPRQQKSRHAKEERSSTFFRGARYNCVQRHRLKLARVVLHIHRGDMTGLLGEIVPVSPASGNRTFPLSGTALLPAPPVPSLQAIS